MLQVYSIIKNKSQLLVHAPTGIGKTASVLPPALTYIFNENKHKIIFFLTSRNTQHLIAIETLKKIKNKYNLNLVAIDLIGKKGMCNQPNASMLKQGEFIEYCKNLRKDDQCPYFSKIKSKGKITQETIMSLKKLKDLSPMHNEEMNKIAFEADLCSFELATMLGKEAHVIISDYNFILSPNIRDSLFQRINKNLSDCIIIFDEGHNVPQRAREILSTKTNTFLIEAATKETKSLGFPSLANEILKLKDIFEELAKKLPLDKQERLISKEELTKAISEYTNILNMIGSMHHVGSEALKTKKRSFTDSLANFLESWLGPNEGFTRILSRVYIRNKPYIEINYKCLDPGILMNDIIQGSHSVILMSGTLTPLDMYADLLNLDQNKALTIEYQNPFPKENRLNIILPETSTKYLVRSTIMYENIAIKSSDITNTIPGNSIIFFPSYYILDQVYEYFKEKTTKTIFTESRDYTKEQRTELIERFKTYKDSGAVLLAVAGGSFSEGVDLPGDLLKGVIVVGLPLAKPDLETQELINFYDKRFSKGWEYGYTIPALIKTLQSAGRCIRSETDRGVIVFLDERYLWPNYKKCFSSDMNIIIDKNPSRLINDFFKNDKT
jgi:DNA excision repair protein ERCC-2